MPPRKDPLVVEIPDVLGEFLDRAEKDHSLFGKNAVRLAERIRQSDQPEALSYCSHKNPKYEWCDTCGMDHPKDGCPPLRKWWVNLVTEEARGLTFRAVGTVEARAAWTAMNLAVERFGHIPVDGQRIAIDGNDYIRTAWDRILDDELGIS